MIRRGARGQRRPGPETTGATEAGEIFLFQNLLHSRHILRM